MVFFLRRLDRIADGLVDVEQPVAGSSEHSVALDLALYLRKKRARAKLQGFRFTLHFSRKRVIGPMPGVIGRGTCASRLATAPVALSDRASAHVAGRSEFVQ